MSTVASSKRAGSLEYVIQPADAGLSSTSKGASFRKSLEYIIDQSHAGEQLGADTASTASSTSLTSLKSTIPTTSDDAASMKDSDEESNSGKVGVTIMPDEITNFTYAMKSGPSSLDPGSMAFLLAWMGGSPGGQTVKAQQQSYLETYRERYPDGVAGVNKYITATTNYLAGKA